MRDRRQSGTQILVVERSPSFARLLRSELVHRGFSHVRLAGDAEEALGLLAGEPFSAVLCDNETRPIGGAAFVRAARTGEAMVDPYLPIIMTSFAPTRPAISACRDAGANVFLAKPVSNDQLTEKLLVCLTEARHFVKVRSYFGPDRRKGKRPAYRGQERRSGTALDRAAIRARRFFAA